MSEPVWLEERENPFMICEGCNRIYQQHQETLTLSEDDYCPRCGEQFDGGRTMMSYQDELEWMEEHEVYSE